MQVLIIKVCPGSAPYSCPVKMELGRTACKIRSAHETSAAITNLDDVTDVEVT
jgi:hypothetical protein